MRTPSIYAHTHSPCEHFARIAYDAIAATIDLSEFERRPDYDEDDWRAERRWIDERVLAIIRGEKPAKDRKSKKEPPAEDAVEKTASLAGHEINWPRFLPELKTWAGQATVETIIEARQRAIHAGELPAGETLVTWQVPLKTCCGLDARTAPNSLDVGFSVANVGMDIMTFAAAELLAIVGMQIAPITRFSRKSYGYRDPHGHWWRFAVVEREGYHRAVTMSERYEAFEHSALVI